MLYTFRLFWSLAFLPDQGFHLQLFVGLAVKMSLCQNVPPLSHIVPRVIEGQNDLPVEGAKCPSNTHCLIRLSQNVPPNWGTFWLSILTQLEWRDILLSLKLETLVKGHYDWKSFYAVFSNPHTISGPRAREGQGIPYDMGHIPSSIEVPSGDSILKSQLQCSIQNRKSGGLFFLICPPPPPNIYWCTQYRLP